MADVVVRESGSNFLLFDAQDAALQWLLKNLDGCWWGTSLAVEHRFAEALATSLQENGFSLTRES